MASATSELRITIPDWVDECVATFQGALADEQAQMQLAIALSRENVARGGGPFGAIVIAGDAVVAAGVNRVLDSRLSIAHAEIVALMRAQIALAGSAPGTHEPLALVTSTEPCCQCFGAIVWSGIARLVCGALKEDAEAIGFDEGPKPSDWALELERRGISVRQALGREQARAVLADYQRLGGPIYGLRSP